MIIACERMRDFDRAGQWTEQLAAFCERTGQRPLLALCRATGIPMNTRLLKRVLPTSTQTRLTRAERAANVKRAFAFHGTEPLPNARIVLVDDVLTTGATASACAKLLRQNGAAVVDVWTVARNILK